MTPSSRRRKPVRAASPDLRSFGAGIADYSRDTPAHKHERAKPLGLNVGKPRLALKRSSALPPYTRKCSLRNRPVQEALHAAISSGVPVTTTSPPACPPSGSHDLRS